MLPVGPADFVLVLKAFCLRPPSARRTQFGAADVLHEPFDPQKAVVAAPELLVGETVKDAVQARAGVAHQEDNKVDIDSVRVLIVGGRDHGVGRPADDENDEDGKKGAGQLHGLLHLFGCAWGLCQVTLLPCHRGGHPQLALPDVLVDLVVANGHQDHRARNPDGQEEERVGQVGGAIDHTAQDLRVVPVVTPRKEVGQV